MTLSFALPKFSGSTLEPSSEPIMLYEPQYYQKGAGRAMHIKLIPTRPTPPLNREFKPPHIVIPKPNFDDMYLDDDQFSAWSYNMDDESSSATTALWDPISSVSAYESD